MFKNNLIAAVLGLSSISLLQADTNPSYQNSEGSDQELQQRVQDKIGHGWFDKGYDQINIRVNNGIVTLDGVVRTEHDKDKIERNVRDMDGVKGLNSQITVKEEAKQHRQFPQDSFSSKLDDQLNQKIRDSVSIGWFNVDYKSVSLHTSDGVVTVEGTVDSKKSEKHLLNGIQEVEGVKAVKSNLVIESN